MSPPCPFDRHHLATAGTRARPGPQSLPISIARGAPRCLAALALPALFWAAPVSANNYGESLAWQFRTTADQANQAAILDLIARHRSGYYAAPIYNTTIAHQVNCSIAASATGNSDGQSAIANSPSVTGAASTATGNSNQASTGDSRSQSAVDTSQTNDGAVSAGVVGSTNTSVHGTASQALNASQSNSGNQSANVQGSNACTFGALN
ncbi:MAG TPA: hypothetical protein VK980_00785 [Sphingomonas sp.]|nr:hypothetical protein [Sphingomonas sp.]